RGHVAMKTRRIKPRLMTTIARQFVQAHLGRNAFAPFTGTDARAWHAFVYLLELWGVSRDPHAVGAMKMTLACAQTKVMDIFIQTIPGVLDWGHVRELWADIAPIDALSVIAVDTDEQGHVVRQYGAT
ncbi:MAG: hypothetical protein ACRELY_15585, partial [Polyangiaceae bacterium]